MRHVFNFKVLSAMCSAFHDDILNNTTTQQAAALEPSSTETATPAPVAEDSQEALTARIQELEKALHEAKDQNLRLHADYDNLRKRRLQEQEQQRKYGSEAALLTLLPVLDNLERAQNSLSETSEAAVLFKSFALVMKQLQDALQQLGLQRVNPIGQPFDPALHEAVARFEAADKEEGTVLHEQQAGYKLHDKLIRVSQVVVSVPPPSATGPEAEHKVDTNPFQSAF
jgi:molecular chaperone GrpE